MIKQLSKLAGVVVICILTYATQYQTILDCIINPSHGEKIEQRAIVFLLALIASILIIKK